MNDRSVFKRKGPLLLACNHPNSFLDAIILGSQFKQPVHFLARGDAFKKPAAKKILSALRLIPIYRLSEGRENLTLNDTTFERCREVLMNKKILLIFSEGLCENTWKLRPLKKGTARIAIDAWQQEKLKDEFIVLPVSLNYNSFKYFGKELIIHFNDDITLKDIMSNETSGEAIIKFNNLLYKRLQNSLIESRASDSAVQYLITNHSGKRSTLIAKLKNDFPSAEKLINASKLISPYYFSNNLLVDFFLVFILLIPAIIGWFLHAPVYFLITNIVKNKTKGTVFYDSVIFGSMLVIYPMYWLLLCIIVFFSSKIIEIRISILLLPVFAWMFIQWRAKVISVANKLRVQNKY